VCFSRLTFARFVGIVTVTEGAEMPDRTVLGKQYEGYTPEHVAPCGLYCGVCRILAATQENDRAFLERLVKVYRRRFPEIDAATADDLLCDGCGSTKRSVFCRECSIRECTQRKGFQGCHECPDFPCPLIDGFPMPVGKTVILRTIPYWRSHGTEDWIAAEEKRYTCPECGQRLFRGAKQCRHCDSPVDVD
jgi:hypothetical protein